MKSNDTQQKTIDFGVKMGREIFNNLLDEYPEIEDDDMRRFAIFQSLWSDLGLYMVVNVCTETELISILIDDIKHARKERPDWFEDKT